MVSNKTILKAALTWRELNETLRGLTREEDAKALLLAHQQAGASSRWLTRIHSRYRQLVQKRLKKERETLGEDYRG